MFLQNIDSDPHSSDKYYLDNREDGIPLSGGLRNPQPVIKVGHIEKGADIIFGIPTVKVYSCFSVLSF